MKDEKAGVDSFAICSSSPEAKPAVFNWLMYFVVIFCLRLLISPVCFKKAGV